MTSENQPPRQRPDFFQGAQMAYEDCAQFIDDMRENLPPELKMLESGLQTMADGIREKIQNLDALLMKHLNAAPEGGNA